MGPNTYSTLIESNQKILSAITISGALKDSRTKEQKFVMPELSLLLSHDLRTDDSVNKMLLQI